MVGFGWFPPQPLDGDNPPAAVLRSSHLVKGACLLEAYLQGLTMGLAYVAPIGLQNLFVINTALTQKRSRAYLTALIVIFFDVTLAFACFFSGSAPSCSASNGCAWRSLLVGSGIVIWIGIGLLRDRGPGTPPPLWMSPGPKVVTTACVVTWFNPQASSTAP